MEWLDKIKDFPNLIQQEPRYGYLVVAGLLLYGLSVSSVAGSGRIPVRVVQEVTSLRICSVQENFPVSGWE